MIEIRIHGRGGQGVVTSGQLIAIAAFYDGKHTQSFPMFGVERGGAPVEAYARISAEKIRVRSQIYNPDIVLVLDSSLIGAVDITKGLKKGGLIIVNTSKKPAELKIKGNFKIYCIDALSISMEIFGRPIVNTPILGAFSAFTKHISLESLYKALDERFEGKGKLIELNKTAIKKVFDSCK